MQSIFGEIIYTGREIKKNCYVNFLGNKIFSVSTGSAGKLLGKYPVIIPAIIDPHCHVGMMRAGEPANEDEANEQMDSLLPLLDPLDSVQMDDSVFRESVSEGILYSCIVPGSGNIIGGRSAVIRNYGRSTSEAFIKRAGIKAAFGFNSSISTHDWKGTRAYTRMGAIAILRAKLDEVQIKIANAKKRKGKKSEEMELTITDKIYRDILEGKEILRCHVHKSDDIWALLRVVDEFNLKITVEHAADVHDVAIINELAKRKIPVVYGPVDSFAYKVELKHESWKNIRFLIEGGVKFGLMTDSPVILQRNLIHQLRWFLRCGYTPKQGIEMITRVNAEIIGVDKVLGTLEKGKWASFVCLDGDPLHLSSSAQAIFGEGKLIDIN